MLKYQVILNVNSFLPDKLPDFHTSPLYTSIQC